MLSSKNCNGGTASIAHSLGITSKEIEMPFGYVCENRADYLALVAIQEELMLRPAKTVEEEEDNALRFAEVDALLTAYEEKHRAKV